MTARLRIKSTLGKSRLGSGAYNSERSALDSVRELDSILNSVITQFGDVSEEITRDAMVPTFQKSQEYCPEHTGAMKRSGYLEVAGFRGKPRVEIGYGKGGRPSYTAMVHELTDMPHAPPTRSKWLQAAVMEDLDDIYVRLGKEYFSFMNGGGGFGQ